MVLGVFRPICVKQINRVAPDIDPPCLEINIGEFNLDTAHQRLSLVIQDRLQGQVLWIEERLKFVLPIVLVDLLLEVAFAIKQADAGKTNVEIAGRFGVIARQNAQAARGDGQRS